MPSPSRPLPAPRPLRRATPFVGAALAVTLAACGGAQKASPGDAPRTEPAAGARPNLVVFFVVDQLSAETLTRYEPHLHPDGAARAARSEGAFHRVAYPYAGTYTAPGHATLGTGALPWQHGVTANSYWNRALGKAENGLEDAAFPTLGAPGEGTSPKTLGAETVGDALLAATHGLGKVVALSLKDRGAVLVGGHTTRAVYWYEDLVPGFTTSKFYADAVPAWVSAWNAAHPVSTYVAPWAPEDAALYGRLLGPDDAPGEGGAFGLGATFPHDVRATPKPLDNFRATPSSATYLLDFAREAFAAERLCADDIPDLLSVSISTTDYVGHTFGPDSWEYLDALRRADRDMGKFAEWVRERCPRTAFVLSADHGAAPLVERSRAEGHAAERHGKGLAAQLDAAVVRALGPGPWVAAYVKPLVHLTDAARGRRAEVVAVLRRELSAWPSVHSLHDPREAAALRASSDPVARAVGLSIHDPEAGDLFLVPAPRSVFDEGGKPNTGTTHGTPWPYDQVVPGLAWGTGVARAAEDAPLGIGRVAATAAALLGIAPPNANPEPPLPGVAPAPPRGAVSAANRVVRKPCACGNGAPPASTPAAAPRP